MSFLFKQTARVLLVLLAPFLAVTFVFEFFGRQYWSARAWPELVFFDRYLVGLLWHWSHYMSLKPK